MRRATVISRLFDPFLVTTVLLTLALQKSTLTGAAQARFFLVVLFSMVGIPAGLLVLAIKKKIVDNWDMTKRGQRPKMLFGLLVLEVMNLVVVRPFADQFLFTTLVTLLASLVGFTLITLFWKISGHTFANALVVGLIIKWFGWLWWPILFIVPLVGWARVVRRDHTVAQVVAGALYACMVIVLFL